MSRLCQAVTLRDLLVHYYVDKATSMSAASAALRLSASYGYAHDGYICCK